jgi:DNA-binding transcriptional LysR family regulator
MDRRLSDSIPLATFRFFEVAAEEQSFTRAAARLLVSQAAVSRRVAILEAKLGCKLFFRGGRRITLTPAGVRLLSHVSAALDHLDDGMSMVDDNAVPIAIAASNAVSHFWLGPLLRDFAREAPGISVKLVSTDAMSDLADDSRDLTLLYTRSGHPRWHLTDLMPEVLVPVASPALVATAGLELPITAGQIAALPLIDYAKANLNWVTLSDWLLREGAGPGKRPSVVYSSYTTTIDAALSGEGVALGSINLIRSQIESGALIEISNRPYVTGYRYCLGRPANRGLSEAALQLHTFLVESGRINSAATHFDTP